MNWLPLIITLLFTDEAIRLPQRAPVRQENVQSVLGANEVYCIESTVPLLLIDSPQGFVRIEPEAGPLRVRGKFAGSDKPWETRTFSRPYLYFVDALKPGRLELIVVNDGEVTRQPLTITGQGPQPPPGPDDDDPPVPPIPPGPPTGLRVLLLHDDSATREQLTTLNSTKVVAWLNANCAKSDDGRPEWRRWDRTSVSLPDALTEETPIWQKLWKDVSPRVTSDNLVIVVTDTAVQMHPMGGVQSTLDLLNRVKEGK